MSIIYRPHRGSFVDAMADARVFGDEEEMKKYICAQWEMDGVRMFDKEDIVIKDEAINDYRNGWEDTRYVCIKRFGLQEHLIPACIGMCATIFPEV